MIRLNFKKLDDKAILPTRGHDESDAGRDIYSIEDVIILPNKTAMIRTGLALEMEFNSYSHIELEREYPSMLKETLTSFEYNFSYFMSRWIKENFKLEFKIESRSGLASKGIYVIGGIIDQSYRGEIRIILVNQNKTKFEVKAGDKIAQGITILIPNISNMQFVESFNEEETNRGNKGFGSTG